MFKNIQQWFTKQVSQQTVYYLKYITNDLLKKKEYAAAEKTLRRILDVAPSDHEVLFILSQVLRRQGKIKEGYTYLKQVTLTPQYTDEIIRFVEAFQQRGELEDMKQTLYEALKQWPQAVELRLYLAQRLFENSKLNEAENELYEVLKIEPHHLKAHEGLTYCHIHRGNKKKALQQIEYIRSFNSRLADDLISAVYENVQNFQ
ncbi:tetratricopeptide repeat protein [Deltaproteobacteria bacterium TL4]